MSSQDQLTENLWFLTKLYCSAPPDTTDVSTEHTSTLIILDAVASYLTTGQSDGVIACYYQTAPATLILAKSGCVTAEDRSAVTLFLKELKAAEGWIDLLPFLAQRSPDEVNKKIKKLRKSFVDCFDDLSEAAQKYQPNPDPSEPEFYGRWSRRFLEVNKLNATKPAEVQHTLIRILELCRDYLTTNQEFGDTQNACMEFSRLLRATRTLFDSQFFCTYAGATRLKRHLTKVVQYLDIAYVIKFYQRLRGEMGVEWVTDVGGGIVKRVLDTTTAGNRFKKAFVEDTDMENEAKDIMLSAMNRKFPGWSGDEEGSIQVTLFVHPEIRLVLDLIERNMVQNLDIVIGCSQRRCFACRLWIKKLNAATRMNVVTNLDYGKLRFDWVYPDLARFTSANNDLGAYLNSDVRTQVECWIQQILGKEQWEAFNICCDRNIFRRFN